MRLARHAIATVALLSGCAPAFSVTRGPGSTAGTTQYHVSNLAFEVPSGFRMKESGSSLSLRFCVEPDITACGALGVLLRNDVDPKVCENKKLLLAWLRSPQGPSYGGTDIDSFMLQNKVGMGGNADTKSVKLADRDAWLLEDAKGERRSAIICDGPQTWIVRELSYGAKGVAPARAAFDAFARTAHLGPAPKPAP